jgi:hypothetical protein
MMRGSYRRGPRLPQPRKDALGRAKQPRWDESHQRANVSHGDAFWNWRPGEIVVGPAKRRPGSFVSLPPDGGDA